MKHQVTTNLSSVQIWDDYLDDNFILDLDEDSNNYSWRLDNVANRKSFPYKRKGSHLFWGSTFPSLEKSPKTISSVYNFIIKELVQSSFNLESMLSVPISIVGICLSSSLGKSEEIILTDIGFELPSLFAFSSEAMVSCNLAALIASRRFLGFIPMT